VLRGTWGAALPDRVGELVERDRRTAEQAKDGQHGTLAGSAEIDRPVVAADRDRSEHVDTHLWTVGPR
jgi:hypothetical protein